MKMKNILTTGILALAGLTVIIPAAKAGFPAPDGDLIVAFSAQATFAHTGKTYLVDLGPISSLTTPGTLHTINLSQAGNFVLDLATAGIGSGGTWSLWGVNSAATNVLMSRPEAINGSQSTPLQNQNLDNVIADIQAVYNTPVAANTSLNPNGIIQLTTDDPSYARYVFGSNSPTQAFEGNFGNPEGSFTKMLDLYQVAPGTGPAAFVGAFDFNFSTGVIRFAASPAAFVPEPSSLLLGLVGLGLCASRRPRRPVVA